jgi:large subunit ribosomal protein L1
LVEKINSGWLDFDVAIATPEMMRDVGRLGKVLGPRGLMPNPKTGTVNADVARAIKEVKSGKIEFKMDKQANINLTVGKISFAPEKIIDNARTVIEALLRAKPAAVKGRFVKNITISSTMGIGLRLDLATVAKG